MHLYLMQNCHGLLKVGVSANPADRLARLRQQLRCEIAIVAVLEHGADLEEVFHIKLRRFRRIGEWFGGTSRAREAVAELFDLGADFTWPHAYDRQAAQAWLAEAAAIYDRRYWDRFRRKVVKRLTDGLQNPQLNEEGCADLDALIGMSLDFALNDIGYAVIKDKKGRLIAVNAVTDEPIPRYTSDRRLAAKLIDPEGRFDVIDHPGTKTQQAIAYCIAVLSVMWGIGIPYRMVPRDDLIGPYSRNRANPWSRNKIQSR